MSTGVELPDVHAAREEARRRAAALLLEGYKLGQDRGNWMLRVRDEAGEIVLDLTLCDLVRAPLATGLRPQISN